MTEAQKKEATKHPKFVWMNGKIIAFEEARIHVSSPVIKFGTAVFEGIRGYWNEEDKELYAFRLQEHYQRLMESVKIMRMDLEYSIEDCAQMLIDLFRKNEFREDVHARHTVYVGGYGNMKARGPIEMTVVSSPRGRSYDIENGIRCAISSWKRIDDGCMPPRIKCNANYQNGRLAYLQAVEDGYDYPLLLTSAGKLSEAPGACVFLVRKGELVAPPVTASILESITRATILQYSKEELNITAVEREVDRTELYVAEEAFLCGSGAEIVPIISVDKFPIANGKPGPVTRMIQKFYFDMVRGKNPKFRHLLTPTYQ
jgi:branched-chain amino acid aminotransferase